MEWGLHTRAPTGAEREGGDAVLLQRTAVTVIRHPSGFLAQAVEHFDVRAGEVTQGEVLLMSARQLGIQASKST